MFASKALIATITKTHVGTTAMNVYWYDKRLLLCVSIDFKQQQKARIKLKAMQQRDKTETTIEEE